MVTLKLGSDTNFQNFCDDWYSTMELADLESTAKNDLHNTLTLTEDDFDLWSEEIESLLQSWGGYIRYSI